MVNIYYIIDSQFIVYFLKKTCKPNFVQILSAKFQFIGDTIPRVVNLIDDTVSFVLSVFTKVEQRGYILIIFTIQSCSK